MKIGHIYLAAATDDSIDHFASLIEAFDRLAIEQHVLVASVALARRLQCCPYVAVGPVVRTAVMAYCLMPKVDLVHVHDDKSGQAGLLLTLTRSTPFVMTTAGKSGNGQGPLRRSVLSRARALIPPSDTDPERLVSVYHSTINAWSKLPQDADCR